MATDRETLDKIAALVTEWTAAATELCITPEGDESMMLVKKLLDERAAEIENTADTRAAWAAEVRSGAAMATTMHDASFGRRLQIMLDAAASFVEHGSDLGGGMMPYRIKTLAQATVAHARTDAARVRVALDAADALRQAGTALFETPGAPSSRGVFKAEEALRAAFGFADPDAATATPDPEKRK